MSISDKEIKEQTAGLDFIRTIIKEDLLRGKHKTTVTRFPPEPNGYLHIGHAKSICLNFGLAKENEGATCNLRFDDTNPVKEDVEYVDSIKEDIKWLGFDWEDRLYFASDYFDKLYDYAVDLIKQGKAFVCELTAEQMREYRGTLKEPGKESPYRNRSVEENLDLFERMKNGEFKDGEKVLRAKIDMSSPNVNMRDPVIYRIKHAHHHRTGDKWCIYPMYDYTHCISDALECITHSLCTLEFEDHRPLYDWVLAQIEVPGNPRQIEFSRLNLNYTIMSKRWLLELVKGNFVHGWDDPRMPTICGMRRRGFTPAAIRNFMKLIGISKKDSIIDMSVLEDCVRDDLNHTAPRVMCVLDPLKVVIDNYDDGKEELIEMENHPQRPELGKRKIPFTKEIYIDRADFMEEAPKKYFRLKPDGYVRLRYGYIIKCNNVVKDANGNVTELHCSYYPETLGGKPLADETKVKGIIHWVSATHNTPVKIHVYDRLFNVENPGGNKNRDYKEDLNPDSLQEVETAYGELVLTEAEPGSHYQFERVGYFYADHVESKKGHPVFNRTATLRDTWAKLNQ